MPVIPESMNDELARVMAVLQQNKDKEFVQRILEPKKYPMLKTPDGKGYMTHKMAWGEADGKFYVYPTIAYDGKRLIDNSNDDKAAWRYAVKNKNLIEFPSAEQADWFSRRYKAFWEATGFDPGAKR